MSKSKLPANDCTFFDATDLVWGCLERAVNRFNRSEDRVSLLCPRKEFPEYKSDWVGASERSIAYRLSFYLECELRSLCLVGDSTPLAVDCEYDRHIGDRKSFAAGAEDRIRDIVKKARKRELAADGDGFYVFSISPDIIVHQRRQDSKNLLVIEIKKKSNPETEKYDLLKLELFTKPKTDKRGYGYQLGAWVIAEDECDPRDRHLRIAARYKNGEPSP